MDPITIIGTLGAIANIVDVVSKSIRAISDLRKRWTDADLTLLSLSSQLTALRAALSRINEWTMSGFEGDPHHQLVMDLDVSIKCCELLMSKIDLLLGELVDNVDEPLDFASIVKVVFKDKNIEGVQKMIEQQTGALVLLLTACNCNTLAEQKQMLEKSKTRKILGRAQLDSASLYVHRDSASVVSRFTDNLSKISVIFSFDSEVFSSRIYQQVLRGSVKDALRRKQSDTPSLGDPQMSKDRTQAIDRRIKDDHRKSRRDYKLVVFGTEDSGKAGLINLTRKAAQVKYSSEELNSYRLLINQNIIREIQNLIRTLIYEGEPRSEVIQEYCELLLNYTVRKDDGKTLERYIGEAIASLWHDLSINTAIKELLGEGFLTPTSYFFEEIRRIALPDYVPSEYDIMKANAAGFRSSGIYETIMPYGDQQYRLFEVVDQGATMSKHMHYLEDSLAIIFFYDMAVYNHMSLSIPGANAFNTAVKQFRSATKSKWFAKSSIILFLNNVTKFREKILHSPLGNYFPDYPGDVSNTSAAEYIVQRFTKANEASLPMYVHWVDPGDPKTVKLLADTVDVIHTEANLSISIL